MVYLCPLSRDVALRDSADLERRGSVTEIPKPSKRAPKPRTRIKPKGKKRTPKRRAAQKRLKVECNALWSRWIKRNDRCELLGIGSHRVCRGPLQAMHGFGKKAYPGVRYAIWNGFSGCAGIHAYYTWRPPEWENYLRSRWGEETYQYRLAQAMLVTKYDLTEVAQAFRSALAAVEP
jgi:hypothetical protein